MYIAMTLKRAALVIARTVDNLRRARMRSLIVHYYPRTVGGRPVCHKCGWVAKESADYDR